LYPTPNVAGAANVPVAGLADGKKTVGKIRAAADP
jgi:hypothetical protein